MVVAGVWSVVIIQLLYGAKGAAVAEDVKKTPYISVKVICPICEKETRQRYIKSKFYQPLEIEKDHHVINYKWVDEQYNNIRPENYYIWFCPECCFADENDVFRGKIDTLWKGRLEFIADKIIKESKKSEGFMASVSRVIDCTKEVVCTEQAILTHLLACYIQESFLTKNNRMPHKASRFYLRLAWLFRERESFGADKSYVPDQYLSFEDFLNYLRTLWPEMPCSEKEALVMAQSYYVDLLNQSGKDDDIKKEITLMFLLLDLNRRVGDLDGAYGYVRSVFTLAMKKRQATKTMLDKGVHSGQLSAQMIEQMQGLITWLTNAIEDASSEGDAVNEEIFWAEYTSAREQALECSPMVPGKVVEVLREKEFHEITCRKVANMCRPPKGQKVATNLPTYEQLREHEKAAKAARAAKAASDDGEEKAPESEGE